MADSCLWHIVSVNWTFEPSFMIIVQRTWKVWPWPSVKMADSCLLHIIWVNCTFEPSFMKILQRMWKIWSGKESQTQTLNLQVWPWPWVKMPDSCLMKSSQWTRHMNQVLWKSFKECGRYANNNIVLFFMFYDMSAW